MNQSLVQKLVVQALQVFHGTGCRHGGLMMKSTASLKVRVRLIVGAGAVAAFCVPPDDGSAGFTEDIYVVVAYQLMDFHIGSVIRAQGHGSVEHKFHVAGTAGFLGGQGYLFRRYRRQESAFQPGSHCSYLP